MYYISRQVHSKFIDNKNLEAKWLSRGIGEVRSILGYSGTLKPSRSNLLIVIVGYEYERAGEDKFNGTTSALLVNICDNTCKCWSVFSNLTSFTNIILIVIVGYEYERAARIIDEISPDHLIIGYNIESNATTEMDRNANEDYARLLKKLAAYYGELPSFVVPSDDLIKYL